MRRAALAAFVVATALLVGLPAAADLFPCLTPSCREARAARGAQRASVEQSKREAEEAKAKREADFLAYQEKLERERQEREAEKAAAAARAAESDARIAASYEERKAKKKAAYELVNAAAVDEGFKGYLPVATFRFLRMAQREGGLEDAVGYVVGCVPELAEECGEYQPRLRVSQAFPDFVVWSFAGMDEGEWVTVTAVTDRDAEKLYQEGQVFDNGLYVFKGMQSMTTVLGAARTAPRFERFWPWGD